MLVTLVQGAAPLCVIFSRVSLQAEARHSFEPVFVDREKSGAGASQFDGSVEAFSNMSMPSVHV